MGPQREALQPGGGCHASASPHGAAAAVCADGLPLGLVRRLPRSGEALGWAQVHDGHRRPDQRGRGATAGGTLATFDYRYVPRGGPLGRVTGLLIDKMLTSTFNDMLIATEKAARATS